MERQQLYETLQKYWGYSAFRPLQLEVIESVLSGHDTLALMPTGAGKSLLYQVPALVSEGICIVITPLVALMKDQVDRLRSLGVNAAAIHAGLTLRQIDLILDNCAWGDTKLLYIAPERAANDTFRTRLRSMHVSLLAVDEAHCISQWGYDFRPSYLRIAELREQLPQVPILALTASATPLVAEDILRHLRMQNGRTVRGSFARPNLSFAIRKTDDKEGQLLRIANNVPGSGIVYVRTRETAEQLSVFLGNQGIDAAYYHAGLPTEERNRRQEAWMNGTTRIMVATNAFGMGIDRADVRFVVHYDICDSLEAYYQEAGRAGRDGHRAYAVLLTGSDDLSRALKRFEGEFPPLEKIKTCYEALFNYLQVGIGDGKEYTFNFDLHDFAARIHMYSGTVYNMLKILQQNGYLSLTDETDNPPRVLFIVGREDLYRIRIEREELDHIIRTLMRLYTGIFNVRPVEINENEIARVSGYTPERVHELLKQLWRLHVIKYIPASRTPRLYLTEERLPTKDLFISPDSYRIRKQMTVERLEAMYRYASNTEECRSIVLQRYFGEENPSDCGICDICLAHKKAQKDKSGHPSFQHHNEEETILSALQESGKSVKELIALCHTTPEEAIQIIDRLLERGKISMGKEGKIKIIG